MDQQFLKKMFNSGAACPIHNIFDREYFWAELSSLFTNIDPNPFPLLSEKKKRDHKNNSVSEESSAGLDYNHLKIIKQLWKTYAWSFLCWPRRF